jgi:hypothetical protein
MSPHFFLLAAVGLLVVAPAPAAEDVARQEDERLLREARVPQDAAGLLTFFRKRTLGPQERQAIETLIVQLGHRSFTHREKASRKLEEWGPAALEFLTAAARLKSDLEISRRAQRCIDVINQGPGPSLPCAAARQLVRHKPPEAVAVLLAYLPNADDESVQDEVLAALTILGKEESRQAVLQSGLRDPVAIRRAAAGFVLGRTDDGKVRDEVRKLLKDPEVQVRLRAAQGLLAGRDSAAVTALIELLAAPALDITWQAEDLLLRVAGETEGIPVLESTKGSSRSEYRDRWLKWWNENSSKIDLSRLDQDSPQRGWTLIAQMSTSKVYEVDRQGKVRWTIENLSGPIDAQLLAGDRVLIAEHHGSRVTERNFQGGILWEKRLDDRPVQAQRLPGGNTFICTYSAVIEVARDGRVLYTHRPEGTSGQIYAGHKLRNGRIVCITLDGRVIELESTTGKVTSTFVTGLTGCYSIQALPRGHFLVSSYNEGKVHELDTTGKVTWRYELPSAYHAERLPNGNTLVSSHGGSRVVEIDRKGKVLNEHSTNAQNVWRVHRR